MIKRYFPVLLTLLLMVSSSLWALTLTVNPGSSSIDLGAVYLEDGFYGSSAGNIELEVSGKLAGSAAELYTHTDSLLTSDLGYTIPDGLLQWKIYWASSSATAWQGVSTQSSAGFANWVPYRVLAGRRILSIDSGEINPVAITLGTQLVRVPAVQPAGRYATRVIYTAIQDEPF